MTIPPSGRNRKPSANVASVCNSPTKESVLGKNAAEISTAKKEKQRKSKNSIALPATDAATTPALIRRGATASGNVVAAIDVSRSGRRKNAAGQLAPERDAVRNRVIVEIVGGMM